MRRSQAKRLSAVAALLAASACASGAGAAESFSLPLASSGSLSGEHVFDVVTIEGTLTVPPLDAAAAGSGTLHLKANRIILGATGVIDATGAGHRGELDGSAGGPGAGGTPTFGDDQTSQPGGGGSHRGLGGLGVRRSNCTAYPGATAGSAVDVGTDWWMGFGSAGGAAQAGPPNPGAVRAGTRGGGVVVLEAATIVIEGRVLADGGSLPEPSPQGAASGAGSGGTVVVLASTLQATEGALLSARGGHGAVGTTSVGGGGGGGRIAIFAGGSFDDLVSDVRGGRAGAAGDADCADQVAGADGEATRQASSGCTDADGDGVPSASCGGDDCDDSDDTVRPGAAEICDAIDHNCDGRVDENPETLCDAARGEMCVDQSCQVVPEGLLDPNAGPEVSFGGGLCSVAAPSSEAPLFAAGWWLVACLAWRRRRR